MRLAEDSADAGRVETNGFADCACAGVDDAGIFLLAWAAREIPVPAAQHEEDVVFVSVQLARGGCYGKDEGAYVDCACGLG